MVAKENREERGNHSSDWEKAQGREGESDSETTTDSISSPGDTKTTRIDKVDQASRTPKKLTKKQSEESCPRAKRANSDKTGSNKPQLKTSHITPKKSSKPNKGASEAAGQGIENKSRKMNGAVKPPSESSEGSDDKPIEEVSDDKSIEEVSDDKPIEEVKEIDILDEAPNGAQSIDTDDETADKAENSLDEDKVNVDQKIEEMELRIEKLEEELREIAALEISLYSVVPEHGSSPHKVHTPARRLSRLYIHACKYWSLDKRASIARNSVSGLVLIAKSCGNDVSRLTFWWSNTVVLREIISQTFGSSHHSSSIGRLPESNGNGKRSDGKPSLKWKRSSGNKQVKSLGFVEFVDDWQETNTFTAALEKIESWIFSRIVESVWWQTLTPHMQPPVKDLYAVKGSGRLLGPALGDQQQGHFSINLWRSAFQDAFQRLCPVRAGGHECGCLPVLARMVMEHCVARLDVAMFNAILRESANEIPTDPVSDPIVDSRVLPIPAGDLSFGSGAQLKNSVGNWSRWLTDLFGMDADDSSKEDQINGEDYDRNVVDVESKSFRLLNALSDLLMLPKDMLFDRSIRKEVCPNLGLPLIKRILCNFTPDEFCPDAVPGAVLEAINSEIILERRQSDKDLISSFPCAAAPVVYCPPSLSDVAKKVADAGGLVPLGRNASIVQRKGYTSDEELDELDSPLTSIIDKMPPSPVTGNGRTKEKPHYSGTSVRYELLREVWSV
ncbi:uncharacterized protein LOC143849578 [Tasmannia lanceolata]|uniref:uncharacterized protein LOC143849578 n=1 Tax=Tasmannia lanceolata TaxID=3420 RepID=UPI004063BB2A